MKKQFSNEDIKKYLIENPLFLNGYYAETANKFNTTYDSIRSLARRIRKSNGDIKTNISNFFSKKEDLNKGILETELYTTVEAKSIEELIKLHKIDTKKYKVSTYWTKQVGDKFRSSLLCTILKEEEACNYNLFESFLTNYKFKNLPKEVKNTKIKSNNCLIINKQDTHYNKYDIYGNNDIYSRINKIKSAVEEVVNNANNLDKIIYIIGSDAFNSEFTGTTTKGTPQQNLLSHEETFSLVLDYEIEQINYLNSKCNNLEVIYVQGNHDEYISWYLIKAIEKAFKDKKIKFDTSTFCRKYTEFGNNLFLFNHGDAVKPEKLAKLFPIECKSKWSNFTEYTIFTGDKHFNHSKDLDGINFYQLPALSEASSKWDDKNGYLPKPEFVAFLYSNNKGLKTIFKEKL